LEVEVIVEEDIELGVGSVAFELDCEDMVVNVGLGKDQATWGGAGCTALWQSMIRHVGSRQIDAESA
jgi:hypothetical protein